MPDQISVEGADERGLATSKAATLLLDALPDQLVKGLKLAPGARHSLTFRPRGLQASKLSRALSELNGH